jgi:hypothetical protein
MERPEPQTSATPYRGLILVAAAIAVLLVVTIVVVVVGGRPAEPELEPGSPEAAIHAYLAAFDDRDFASAHEHFSSEVRDGWPLEAYERAVDDFGEFDTAPTRRVLFARTEMDGDVARVHLTVEEFYGDGLSGDTFRSPRVVRMVREDGAWRIDEPLVWLDPGPSIP